MRQRFLGDRSSLSELIVFSHLCFQNFSLYIYNNLLGHTQPILTHNWHLLGHQYPFRVHFLQTWKVIPTHNSHLLSATAIPNVRFSQSFEVLFSNTLRNFLAKDRHSNTSSPLHIHQSQLKPMMGITAIPNANILSDPKTITNPNRHERTQSWFFFFILVLAHCWSC